MTYLLLKFLGDASLCKSVITGSFFNEFIGDQQATDFGSSGTDFIEFGIPVKAVDGILQGLAVPAMNLKRFVYGTAGSFGSK